MKRIAFGGSLLRYGLILCTTSFALAQEVSVGGSPRGMVLIAGGEFLMGATTSSQGAEESAKSLSDAQPRHPVFVDEFWMDVTAVTNKQFEEFVTATGYVTMAERAPAKNLVGSSVVFAPTENDAESSSYVKDASWRHPEGPGSDIIGKENFPVVQVAYADAEAFARWAGKRLPTEAEFEYAARGGLAGKSYAWGDELRPNQKWMANTRQGEFPTKDSAEDGYAGLAPVGKFSANGYGLYDMAGNVWQWCSDWYRADYYAQLAKEKKISWNPEGPHSSFDPAQPNEKKRVWRGGSFLCDEHCSCYLVAARGKGYIDSGTNHLGFRCVRSAKEPLQANR